MPGFPCSASDTRSNPNTCAARSRDSSPRWKTDDPRKPQGQHRLLSGGFSPGEEMSSGRNAARTTIHLFECSRPIKKSVPHSANQFSVNSVLRPNTQGFYPKVASTQSYHPSQDHASRSWRTWGKVPELEASGITSVPSGPSGPTCIFLESCTSVAASTSHRRTTPVSTRQFLSLIFFIGRLAVHKAGPDRECSPPRHCDCRRANNAVASGPATGPATRDVTAGRQSSDQINA